MAGNKISKRKSAGTKVKCSVSSKEFPASHPLSGKAGIVRRIAMYELSGIAERSLGRIAGEGAAATDWSNLLHRTYLGVHIYRKFWKADDDVESLFLDAFTALWIMRLRHLDGWDIGCTYDELEHLKLMVAATLEFTLNLSDLQVAEVSYEVQGLMDHLSGELSTKTDQLSSLVTAIKKRVGVPCAPAIT